MEYADSRVALDVVSESRVIIVSYDPVFDGASNIPPVVLESTYF